VWFTCVRSGDNPASCVYNTDEHLPCSEGVSHFRALQAFLILLIIVALPLLVAAILETIHRLQVPGNRRIPGPLGIATVYLILGVFGILFSLVAFAIAFAIPDRKFCTSTTSFSDAPGFGYSAAPIFALFAWFAMIAVVVVSLLVPGPDDEPVAAKSSVGHGTANEPNASPSATQQQAMTQQKTTVPTTTGEKVQQP